MILNLLDIQTLFLVAKATLAYNILFLLCYAETRE